MVAVQGTKATPKYRQTERRKRGSDEIGEQRLQEIVEEEIRSAIGYLGGDISEERRRAINYYYGDPFGNEQEGRSSVVSTDVQDVVEGIMPDLMEVFVAGDTIVEFQPRGPEDEDIAEQATDYCNYIYFQDNPGFQTTHDWIKDALLQKNGVVRVDWDESETESRHTLENVTSAQLFELNSDSEVEIIEFEEKPVEDPRLMMIVPDGILYDLTIIRKETDGRVVIRSLPPEEFLIARRAVELAGPNDKAPFTCHKRKVTASEMLQMGFSKEEIDDIPSHDDQDYNEERVSRFDDDEWPELNDSQDPAMREIWLYDCFIEVDFDGDGITEMRNVIVGGPGFKVLRNEAVDDHPFCSVTPIKIPHKFFGRSFADLTEDVQLIKSTIQRQTLDNMYGINNNRAAISKKVNIDDYLNKRVDGVIRVDTQGGDVAGHVHPLMPTPIIQQTLPLLEYWDSVRETRTGINRLGQGLDPDALDQTATGMNLLLGRTQLKKMHVARMFAETGFADCFRKILRLVVTRQERSRVIRLRNKWVEVDPSAWNAEMDVQVAVGLGSATNEAKIAALHMVAQKQEAIIAGYGPDNPLVGVDNLYNTYASMIKAMGIKNVNSYFKEIDPKKPIQVPKPPPDPKLLEMQAKQQESQARLQIEQQKLQLDSQKHQDQLQFDYWEAGQKFGVEVRKQDLEVRKRDIDASMGQGDLDIKRQGLMSPPNEENSKALVSLNASEQMEGQFSQVLNALVQGINSLGNASEQMAQAAQLMSAPKTAKRNKDGSYSVQIGND